MPDVDVAVIGAGAAGLSVAAIAAGLGLKVALFERGAMGGDCLNYGCVPSKALLAAAHAAAEARRAHRFGVQVGEPRVEWAGVRAHVAGAIAAIAPNDSAERFRGMGVDVVQAGARFVARDTIEAGGRQYRFRRAVVAAGSAAIVPPIPGLAEVPFLTNETLFSLPERPGHLVIIGGGPIGLEMAQAHARLGCRVSAVEAFTIAAREEPECVAPLRDALLADGVALHEGARVERVEASAGGVTVVLTGGARVAGTHLLLAVGRAPRLDALGLEAGGVAFGPRGVATSPALRSVSNRRVWAAGDIADPVGLGPRAFTHVCSQHAGIIARAMLFRLPAKLSYDALPRVTYTDPEIAQIGPTEAELRAAGRTDLTILRWPLAENDRLIAEGRAEGLVKLVADAKGRLLGASLVGAGAGNMAGMFALMIGRKLSTLAGAVLPYPTAQEAAKRAASDFYTPKLLSAPVKRLVGWLKHLP
ncbi:NAD(P)/FAD-dependent oxidoreductase [Roseomonas sp. CECT 9278]|uniref:dihydrolipoyl dehydrogenase family protein n=1 Tax=Roseomonas sp. CECT 9278 TaxID=2845823 RepID=UPI001E4659AB|nr:FAD-dependent oxidoreductase [Roseomonas sp. CECT 9278]CAH0238737.1 Mercuric reductase [Roseomonas sp. CECT 9278]